MGGRGGCWSRHRSRTSCLCLCLVAPVAARKGYGLDDAVEAEWCGRRG